MFLLILTCSLVGLCVSQEPKQCTSPTTWECNEIKVDPSRNFTKIRRLSYDARNRRERRVETVERGSNKTFYDELILWNENKMYRLDLKTRKCNITVPHRGWVPRGTHPGDTFLSINTVGAAGYPEESITVLQFMSNKTEVITISTLAYRIQKSGLLQKNVASDSQ
ncbi:uncharacterized protein LOC125650866 isoform X2 [Ostrea edulis]|uniref:uncharacterized protein LOC125650866 isoform X2 n=1 Tax=Ostrea edulis TaxID=37623 RepID=UPI0020964497|nr:uncharacterized protein LOC125650866 isoform X2 [Ostrea edulis]